MNLPGKDAWEQAALALAAGDRAALGTVLPRLPAAAAQAAPSARSDFRNLRRAGVLKNRSRTIIVVPSGQPVSYMS